MTPQEEYTRDFLAAETQIEKDMLWYRLQWSTGDKRDVLKQIFKKLSMRWSELFAEHQTTRNLRRYIRARENNSNVIEQTMFDAGILDRLPTIRWRRKWYIKAWKLEKNQTDWSTNCSVSAELARNYFYHLLKEHSSLPDSFIDRMDKEFLKVVEMKDCLPNRRVDITSGITIERRDTETYDQARS